MEIETLIWATAPAIGVVVTIIDRLHDFWQAWHAQAMGRRSADFRNFGTRLRATMPVLRHPGSDRGFLEFRLGFGVVMGLLVYGQPS